MTATSTEQLLQTWQLFEISVLALHAAALYFTLPPGGARLFLRHACWWPLSGGSRAFVFQLLSWALFALSLLVALPPWRAHWIVSADVDSRDLELLAAVAAFSAAVSLLFMLKSVLLFDPSEKPAAGHLWGRFQQGRTAIHWDVSRLPSKLAASYIVVGLGLVWSAMGAALLLASQHMAGSGLRVAYFAFSAACFTIAAFSTHGLGGHLRYSYGLDRSHHGMDDSAGQGAVKARAGEHGSSDGGGEGERGGGGVVGWRFFQPFRGGTAFVATQAVGWALYGTALALVLNGTAEAALGVAHCLRAWRLAAGTTAMAAELLLAVSLLTYEAGELPPESVAAGAAAARSALSHAAVMVVLYVPMHCVAAAVVATFLALPPLHALALCGGALFVYYSATGFTGAEHTGSREWGAFREWLGSEAERVLPQWLGSMEVRVDPGAEFPPGRRYVFGYAPHGLYPLGAAYLPLTPSFRRLLPGVRPATLTASLIFQLPLLRDILCWAGCRAVVAPTFVRTLRERGAVLVVPGGQAELVEAHRMFPQGRGRRGGRRAECVVYTRHRGFVRLAIKEGACLVPVLALGEVRSVRNLVSLPALQRWTYRRLGFPVPFLIVGRLGLLPLPARTGLRFVVGRPIEPPRLGPGEEVPTEEQVAAVHAAFYAQLERLYVDHGKDFLEYDEVALVRV